MMIRIVGMLVVLMCASPVWAATYYVGPTGSDSNTTTQAQNSATPWRNPQKCAATMAAGDTCLIQDGTYTDHDNDGSVLKTVLSVGGVRTTFRSVNQYGAQFIIPGRAGTANAGILVQNSTYTFDGFDISGGSSTSSLSGTSHLGFYVTGVTNVIIVNNRIHDVARTLCYNTPFGNNGVFADFSTNLTIERNIIHSVGRRYNGESGCTTSIFNHDHGIYMGKGNNGVTIKNNLFYNFLVGYPIHPYSGDAGGDTPGSSNINIWNNTIADKALDPNHVNPGQIQLGGVVTTANIRNNICYNPSIACVTYSANRTMSGVTIDFNTSSLLIDAGRPSSGVTVGSNNNANRNPLFTNAGSRDYTLTFSSPEINDGVTIASVLNDLLGNPRPVGGSYDIGAYEFGGDSTPPAAPTGVTIT